MAKQKDVLSQSFYAEQLTKTMLQQSGAVQAAFAAAAGHTQKERREYYAEKIGFLVKRLQRSNLWDHQKQDITNAQKHISDVNCEPIGISVIPTGGGKTRIFQEETNALAIPLTVNNKTVKITPRIIQLFPTTQLIRQTKKKYAEQFPGLQVGEARGGKVDIKPITLMTYDLFEDWVEQGKIRPNDIDMLLMDEAHRGLSNNRQEAIKPFLDTAVVRAFTATPVFDAEKNVYTLLGKDNEVSRFSYDELIDAGHIAPIVNPVLKIRINGKLPEDADERQKLLSKLFEEELLNFYLTFKDEKTGQRLFGKPFVGYVNTVERAEQMAKYFDSGIRSAMVHDASLAPLLEQSPAHIAEHISGKNTTTEQDGLIDRIKNGQTLGVFNDQWMVEGTDIPNLGATLRSPTSSLVVEVQSGGRAGRINPEWPHDDPRQTSFVVDVCFEVNGKIMGKPRFFFEAINAPSTARVVSTPVIDIDHGPVIDTGGKGRKRKHEDYEVLNSDVDVNHLLKQRHERLADKDEHWLSVNDTQDSEIVAGGQRVAIKEAVQHLTGESSPYDSRKLGIQTVEYKGQFIDLQKMQSGSNQPICIRREHWDRVEKVAGAEAAVTLPDKDEHWLSSSDTQDAETVLGGKRITIVQAVKHLTGASSPYDSVKRGIQAVEYKGQAIDLQKMQSGPKRPICIRREHWNRVEKAAGVEAAVTLPDKDEHWLAASDTRDSEIVPGGTRRSVEEVVNYLTGESSPYDSGKLGIQTITYKGQFIDLQKMQAGKYQSICIRRKHWDRVEKAAGMEAIVTLSDKDEHWLSASDTRDSEIVPGGTRRPVQEVVKYLTGASSPYDSGKLGIQVVDYKGQSIDLQKMQSGPNQPVCIRREHWGRVEKAAGMEAGVTLPNKDEHWLSSMDTHKAELVAGGTRQPVQEVVKFLTGASSPYDSGKLGIQTVEYMSQSIDLQKMQSGPKRPICIRREHWDRVEKAAGVESLHVSEGLKARPITPKDTKPGGKDLKRTGRSRGTEG